MENILCGVDLGGTKLSIGLVNQDGSIIDKLIIYDHQLKDEDIVIEQVALSIKRLLLNNYLTEAALLGIGIGFAGHMRFNDGVIITTSNLPGFKNYPIRDQMQQYFKVPVTLDNDANAQAFGEFQFGAGKGYDSLIFLTISTGIGAGIIINHKLYRGQTGTAGEFGHTIIDPNSSLQCTCGNYGCLMACASGLALPKLYRKKLSDGMESKIIDAEKFDFDRIDGKFILAGYKNGDPICDVIIQESADYIGIGLYNLFQTFNPPLILLGGGLTCWGDLYLDRIKSKFYGLVKEMLYDPIQINLAKLGHDAGLIGAAALPIELI